MGRINYGKYLHDFKGILGDVKINDKVISNPSDAKWNIWTLPLNNTQEATFTKLNDHPG